MAQITESALRYRIRALENTIRSMDHELRHHDSGGSRVTDKNAVQAKRQELSKLNTKLQIVKALRQLARDKVLFKRKGLPLRADDIQSLEDFGRMTAHTFSNARKLKEILLHPDAVREFGLHDIKNVYRNAIDPNLHDFRTGDVTSAMIMKKKVDKAGDVGVEEHPSYQWVHQGHSLGYARNAVHSSEVFSKEFERFMEQGTERYQNYLNADPNIKKEFKRVYHSLPDRKKAEFKALKGMQLKAPEPGHFDSMLGRKKQRLFELTEEGARKISR